MHDTGTKRVFFVISSVDLVWLLSEKVEDQQRLTKIIVAASVLEGRCHCPLTITMLAAGAGLFFGLQKRNFPTKVFLLLSFILGVLCK